MQSVIRLIREDLERFGFWRACHDVLVRSINRVVLSKSLRILKIDSVDPKFVRLAPEYQARFLNAWEMAALLDEPEFDVTQAFLDDVMRKGDACFGIFRGPTLVSSGWYATQSPTATTDGLEISVPRDCVYLYKAFTRARDRGHHLLAAGASLALEHFLAQHYTACILFIESNNFSSLNAFSRLGAKPIGRLRLLKLRHLTMIVPSRGLVQSAVTFNKVADEPQPSLACVGN